MNKYELTTEKKKAAIIQAALHLFEKKGLAKVNMKEIATEAGVATASIYNYFGSKQNLVGECFNVVMADTFQKAEEILSTKTAFLKKLEQTLALCTVTLNQSISQHFSSEALKDPALKSLLIENVREGKRKIYRQYIEAGKSENAINPSIPTDLYLDYIDAINTINIAAGSTEEFEQQTHMIHQLFLYGIVGK